MKSILLHILSFALILANVHTYGAEDSTQKSSSSTGSHLVSPAPSVRAPDAPGPVFPLEDFMETHEEKQNDRFWSEFLNMLATLGMIIGVILIAAWFLRRLLNTRLEQINISSSIKITERRSLSPKTALYLLEVNDKAILIAESQNGVTLLSQFSPESGSSPEEAPPETNPSSFTKILESKPNNQK